MAHVKSGLWLVLGLSVMTTCEPPTEAPTTGKISGTILDASSSQPISGVAVTTDPITSSKTADGEGNYNIEGVEPGTYTVQASKSEYKTNTTIVNVIVGETASADIQLVPQGPELAVSTPLINFGTSSTSLTFSISNSGIGTLTWNIISNANWVTINPASGTAETETDVVTVTVDRTAKSYGNHYETITVTSNANAKTIDIVMTIPNPNEAQLSVVPISLDFGNSESEMMISLSNTGTGMLTWNITDDKSWISVAPQSGTTEAEVDEITVTLDRLGHTPGTYNGIVTVSSDGGNQAITVIMTVPDEPTLSLSPNQLDFGSTETLLSFDVANAGSGDLTWSVTDNQDWIAVSPDSGTNFGSVNVSASRSGLSTGDYSGSVTVSSNAGTGDVIVVMNVPADLPPAAVQLHEPTDITSNAMTVSWEISVETDFLSYKLYRASDATVDESSTLVTTITNRYTVEYTDQGLSSSKEYYHRLYVEDQAQQTTGSNVVSGTTVYALGSWSVVTTLGDKDLVSVHALDDNLAYAVGDSGTLAKWNGSSWSSEQSPTLNDLKDIVVLSANNVWMVGSDGVFHFNGTIWSQSSQSPHVSLGAIAAIDENNVWVGSDTSPDIYYYDGSDWTKTVIGGIQVRDIDMLSSDLGYVLVSGFPSSFVYGFNGFGWALIASIECSIGNIKGFSNTDIWVSRKACFSGNYPTTVHWDGATWTYYNDYSTMGPLDIDGYSPDNLWTCTFREADSYVNYFWHWDGSDWTWFAPPTDRVIRKFNMYSTTDGWAVGDGGVILRYH